MKATKTSTILFDLGGVLINFIGIREVAKLTPEQLSEDEARGRWISSPVLKEYESGRISTKYFANQFVEEWKLSLTPNEFLFQFKSWVRSPLNGMEKLLKDLSSDYNLACLSNTNKTHWDRMFNEFGLNTLLDYHFASHIMGVMKPDPRSYELVCENMNVVPEEVIFFDDGQDNVLAARKIGMQAYQVNGIEEIRVLLKALQIL